MPERPPKKWFYRCVKRVREKAPQVSNPKALCGWIWHHHAKASTKRQILRAEKKMKKGNPSNDEEKRPPAEVEKRIRQIVPQIAEIAKIAGETDADLQLKIFTIAFDLGNLIPGFWLEKVKPEPEPEYGW
jgi:hypothetical protein